MFFLKNTWPTFSDDEIQKVTDILRSGKVNYWTGDETKTFEKEFADYVGLNKAIAVANGTLALDLALYGLKIGERNDGQRCDEVIVTPRSFIASVSTVKNAGAKPVFADIDLNSGNITADTIEAAITSNTKAIIAVHLAGWPCEMDSILELARQHDIKIIEDCAQAHGAIYKGKPVGSIGDVGVWSFCQDKIITTGGEGGMVATNNEDMWLRMWSYKDHGKNWHAIHIKDQKPGFKWVHDTIGTNFRLTEMQSAIGRIQLTKLNEWKSLRNRNANFFREKLSELHKLNKINIPKFQCGDCSCENETTQHCQNANYKFYLYLNENELNAGYSRDRIIEAINASGAPCFHGSCGEIYKERAFSQSMNIAPVTLTNAKSLSDRSLMLLVHPNLELEELEIYGDIVKTELEKAFL